MKTCIQFLKEACAAYLQQEREREKAPAVEEMREKLNALVAVPRVSLIDPFCWSPGCNEPVSGTKYCPRCVARMAEVPPTKAPVRINDARKFCKTAGCWFVPKHGENYCEICVFDMIERGR